MNQFFLPISKEEMLQRDWYYYDILLVTGDAYVDHPSFGAAIIGRYLESLGLRVALLSQPRWDRSTDFTDMGAPRYAVMITAGNLDSMVNHYTAAKKRRNKDAYSPGGKTGLRPDRATVVYSKLARKAFGNIPIIIGGIEASLRRFAHYDYWDNSVRPSILVESTADLLVYGMGEHQIEAIGKGLKAKKTIEQLNDLPGVCYLTENITGIKNSILLKDYQKVASDKVAFAENFRVQYQQQDPVRGKTIIEPYGDRYLVQNKPSMPLDQEELDRVYELPYTRQVHPRYSAQGVPAISEVQFSLTSSRGCFGSCSFCALTFHQGRIVQSRSHESIINEGQLLTEHPEFKGYIHDVGGPTANFREPACEKQLTKGTCLNKNCLFPAVCSNIKVNHSDYLKLLKKLREIPKVKKVFIRSGIRYDYLIADHKDEFFNELCKHHVSGQLKVAPEHVSPKVLQYMGKPRISAFENFVKKYQHINQRLGKNQYLVPYFMSSHPGSTLREAIVLAEYIRDMGYNPEQVQDFIPTPGTISTCMFYTGIDPRTMDKVYVVRDAHEKAMQRALIQYRNPNNYDLVYEALVKAGRTDLIGFGPKCLIKPRGNKFSTNRKKINKRHQDKKRAGKRLFTKNK